MLKFLKPIILIITFFISAAVFAQSGVSNTLSIKQLVAGSNHSLALLNNGSLWAWGNNARGQLGDSSTTDKDNPVRIGTENNWASITAGSGFTHGIKTDGTLWGWGINKVGQLGIPTTNLKYMYTTPVQIGKDNDWQMVSSGNSFTVGLKTDGTIWVWGTNMNNIMHDKANQYEPLKIDDKNNIDWKQIAAGDEFFMAIKKDGTLWTKGMINNTLVNKGGKKIFFKVNDDKDWASMDAGRQHAVALKKDGTIWAWGANESGQLGNGTKAKSKDPVKVGENFAAITATDNYTAAIKKNGAGVWWWGQSWPVKLGNTSPVFTGKTSTYPFIAARLNGILTTAIDYLLIWEFSIDKNYGGSMKAVK